MNKPLYAAPLPPDPRHPRRWLDDPTITDTDPVPTPPEDGPDAAALRARGEDLASQLTAYRAAELAAPIPRGERFAWLRWLALPRRVSQIERVLTLQGEPVVARWPKAIRMAWAITRDTAIGRKDGD